MGAILEDPGGVGDRNRAVAVHVGGPLLLCRQIDAVGAVLEDKRGVGQGDIAVAIDVTVLHIRLEGQLDIQIALYIFHRAGDIALGSACGGLLCRS